MLTPEQIAFFKDQGYLIVPGALNADLCARARDRLWASLPPGVGLKRGDVNSHIGPFADQDHSSDSLNLRDGYRWQVRDLGTEPDILNLAFGPEITAIAEQLLGVGRVRLPVPDGSPMGRHGPAWPGGPVDPAMDVDGARGIYCTLPFGDLERKPNQGHTDGHPFHLGAVGLIHEVPVDGGAFMVWPGSHKRLYPTFQMQYDQPRIPYYPHLPSYKGIVHSPQYLAELAKVHEDTNPVDCWGRAGDVVLFHHRMAHMAGQNYSSVIRQALLWDFSTTDLDQLRLDPPQEDMWRDWSEELRANRTGYSKEFAQAQRLDHAATA